MKGLCLSVPLRLSFIAYRERFYLNDFFAYAKKFQYPKDYHSLGLDNSWIDVDDYYPYAKRVDAVHQRVASILGELYLRLQVYINIKYPIKFFQIKIYKK